MEWAIVEGLEHPVGGSGVRQREPEEDAEGDPEAERGGEQCRPRGEQDRDDVADRVGRGSLYARRGGKDRAYRYGGQRVRC